MNSDPSGLTRRALYVLDATLLDIADSESSLTYRKAQVDVLISGPVSFVHSARSEIRVFSDRHTRTGNAINVTTRTIILQLLTASTPATMER